jgi:hypothetical protein
MELSALDAYLELVAPQRGLVIPEEYRLTVVENLERLLVHLRIITEFAPPDVAEDDQAPPFP